MVRCEIAVAWRARGDAVILGPVRGGIFMDKPRRHFRPIHLLLLIPYVAMMWVGSYNRIAPEIAGIPFFYWYQILWIVLGAAVMIPVYLADERHEKTPR
jgi:hypothetical protein